MHFSLLDVQLDVQVLITFSEFFNNMEVATEHLPTGVEDYGKKGV